MIADGYVLCRVCVGVENREDGGERDREWVGVFCSGRSSKSVKNLGASAYHSRHDCIDVCSGSCLTVAGGCWWGGGVGGRRVVCRWKELVTMCVQPDGGQLVRVSGERKGVGRVNRLGGVWLDRRRKRKRGANTGEER
jgi:hypothetical protein